MIADWILSAVWTTFVFCCGYVAFSPVWFRLRRECIAILRKSEAIDLAAKKLIEEYHVERERHANFERERSLAGIRAASRYLAGPSEERPGEGR